MPSPAGPPDDERWNHSLHHLRRLVDELAPRLPGAPRVLDVGCGEGVGTRLLATRIGPAVGLDPDPASLAQALAQGGAGVAYVRGDLLAPPLRPASFDLVVCVATLHHTDTAAGLRALAAMVRHGGWLAVVGLARTDLPRDLPYEAASAVATRWHQRRHGLWETPAPKVWPPADTAGAVRAVARRELPGCRFRRHLLWRYTLTWQAPQR